MKKKVGKKELFEERSDYQRWQESLEPPAPSSGWLDAMMGWRPIVLFAVVILTVIVGPIWKSVTTDDSVPEKPMVENDITVPRDYDGVKIEPNDTPEAGPHTVDDNVVDPIKPWYFIPRFFTARF